eukprot:RCo012636
MAVRVLNWLSEKVGIDITGETQGKPGEEDVFDRIGKKVFGPRGEEEDGGPLPTEGGWGYAYNQATGQWEPTANAPSHIHQEQQQRLAELSAPPPVVEPPPMLPPTSSFSYHRDMRGPMYADIFNGGSQPSGTSPPPPATPTPPSTSPLLPSPAVSPLGSTPSFTSVAPPFVPSNGGVPVRPPPPIGQAPGREKGEISGVAV